MGTYNPYYAPTFNLLRGPRGLIRKVIIGFPLNPKPYTLNPTSQQQYPMNPMPKP